MTMLWDQLSRNTSAGPAIVSDAATLSYAELIAHAERVGAALTAAGAGPGHVVLAYFDNTPAFLVALLATARIGAAFAPIDIGVTDAEALGLLELSRSDLILCDPASLARCERWSKNLVTLTARGELVESRIAGLGGPSVDPSIGIMQFSSGTTGASKGILLGHEALFYRSHYLSRALGLSPSDRTLCTLPLSHTHGAECLALPSLLTGGTLYLKSPRFAFPLYILEEIARHGITFFSSIPQFYDAAVKLALEKTPDLSSLRLPFCGSAALARTTAEAFFAKFGVHIRQGYGLAELSVICVNMHDGGRVVYDAVGKPLDGIDWRLDGDTAEGELLVRSKAMFAGYINGEEATRERLVDGWLHTGDIVRVDGDGLVRIVGRKEDFIKVNGFKVYASEIESAIIAVDWIAECAVLGERDEVGAESIVAHVVPRDASRSPRAVHDDLIRHLRTVLSDYKLPKRSVVWRELPKNPLGKILKSKIRTSLESNVMPTTTYQPLTPSGKGLRIADRRVTDFSVQEIRELIARYQWLAFKNHPVSLDEVKAWMRNFGTLVDNDRRDGGVLKLDASRKEQGEVLLGEGFMPLHRDGALMGNEIELVGIYCVQHESVTGGRTFVSDIENGTKQVPAEILELVRERGIEGRPVDRYYTKATDQWHKIPGFTKVDGEEYLAVGFPYRPGEKPSWLLRMPGVDDERCAQMFETMRSIFMSEQYCYFHEWDEGDLLLLDNRRTLHGREAFQGHRALANLQVRAA